MALAWEGKTRTKTTLELIQGDRRNDRRYPTELELQYGLLKGKQIVRFGHGRTCEMSSGGLSFRTDEVIPEGTKLQLSVNWPTLLENVPPLELRVNCRVVRSTVSSTAVQADSYEFRPGGRRFLSPSAVRANIA